MKRKKKPEIEHMCLTDYGDFISQRIDYRKRIVNQSGKMDDLKNRIVEMRKIVIGSDASLRKLITHHGDPDVEAMNHLRMWFTRCATLLLKEQGTPDVQERADEYYHFFERFFYFVFWYCTIDYAYNCIDDLIVFAECYRECPRTFRVVISEAMEDMGKDFVADEVNNWVGYPGEHPQAPYKFTEYVTCCIACFLGTMTAPTEVREWH